MALTALRAVVAAGVGVALALPAGAAVATPSSAVSHPVQARAQRAVPEAGAFRTARPAPHRRRLPVRCATGCPRCR